MPTVSTARGKALKLGRKSSRSMCSVFPTAHRFHGSPNTTIEVHGLLRRRAGSMPANIVVHGDATIGVANAMAQGRIYRRSIGARGMTMTKSNPASTRLNSGCRGRRLLAEFMGVLRSCAESVPTIERTTSWVTVPASACRRQDLLPWCGRKATARRTRNWCASPTTSGRLRAGWKDFLKP